MESLNHPNKGHQGEHISRAMVSFDFHEPEVVKRTPSMTFIYKKTEKISAVLYILSDTINPTEPAYVELRRSAINVLNGGVNLLGTETPRVKSADALVVELCRLISLLEISYVSGLISLMNRDVLRREIEDLVRVIEQSVTQSAESIYLSRDIMDIDFKEETFLGHTPKETIFSGVKNVFNKPQDKSRKHIGHSKGHTVGVASASVPVKDKESSSAVANHTTMTPEAKGDRRTLIVDMLRKEKELSIKDFVLGIPGVSEKTIQRELLYLVKTDVLKKQGERRWSRYSLN